MAWFVWIAPAALLLAAACSPAAESVEPEAAAEQLAARPTLTLCPPGPRDDCVHDGDTFWLAGEKVRLLDIDTPELNGRCAAERALALRARDRMLELLNEGPFDLVPEGARDRDRNGRLLRKAVRGGRSLGDQLVEEGLARPWTGRREPWC